MRLRHRAPSAALVGALVALTGCAAASDAPPADGPLRVVATTQILADLVGNVGGAAVDVTSLVPPGADPHSHEPTLRDVRDIVYADAAFTNYLLLEQQSIVKALDANLRDDVPNIALAESAVKHAAEIIPLVENVALDAIWLGLRVDGDGRSDGADRSSSVLVSATGASGPGDLFAYLTGSFGDVSVYVDSADGFDEASGYRDDTATLPPDAHTHVSWAFTEPGVYTLDLSARLAAVPGEPSIPVAGGTVTFAVGVDPHGVRAGATVLDSGHSDLTVDLDGRRMLVTADHTHGTSETHTDRYDLEDVVIAVPSKAALEIPGDPAYRFLGRAGTLIHQLPQAVLGRHVHGEIDPHLWQNVRNAIAYVKTIADELVAVDPENAALYRSNAADYIDELDELDAYVRDAVASIPPSRRTLVTTHDAFGYLGRAYDLTLAGFVTPNPATEPSIADRKRLTQTIRTLEVPAVFLEPALAARSSTLTEVAREADIAVCPIYSDALDYDVPTYVDMMRFNADSLVRCLTR
jgi:anchored repeat ABC transporter substrate-binding protein